MSDVLSVVAKIHPKPGREDDVQAILVRMAAAVRAHEPDCLVYRPHRSVKAPTVFVFYEQYRTQAAFDFHASAPHLTEFRAQMKGLLEKPTEIEFYRSLTD